MENDDVIFFFNDGIFDLFIIVDILVEGYFVFGMLIILVIDFFGDFNVKFFSFLSNDDMDLDFSFVDNDFYVE